MHSQIEWHGGEPGNFFKRLCLNNTPDGSQESLNFEQTDETQFATEAMSTPPPREHSGLSQNFTAKLGGTLRIGTGQYNLVTDERMPRE